MTSYFGNAYKVSSKYFTSRNYAIIFGAQRDNPQKTDAAQAAGQAVFI